VDVAPLAARPAPAVRRSKSTRIVSTYAILRDAMAPSALPSTSASALPLRGARLATLAALGLAVALAGCRGGGDARPGASAGGDAGGTVVIATPSDVDILLPPLGRTLEGKKAADLLFDRLADVGAGLNTVGDEGFTPQLAERWTWAPDSLSIAFHLNPAARWHDGVPVRASDVRFTHAVYSDPAVGSPIAPNVADIDSVTVRDSLTAVFWFKHRFPEQFFEAVYHMHVLPEHLLGREPRAALERSSFARSPVGSGRFRFARWVPGQTLEMIADTGHYRGRPKLDRVMFSVAPDFTAASTKLFAGEADFFETMRPEQLPQIAKHASLRTVPYPSLDIGYLRFNLRDAKAPARPNAVFGDRAVRRALTMALDRPTLVRSVLDTLGYVALGPFTRAQFSADTTIPQLRFDVARARATLDSAGWRDADGDGIREKAGRRLEFSMLVPNSSRNRMRFAVLMQEQFKQVGAVARIEELEFNAFIKRLEGRDFDAAIEGGHLDPSPSVVRQSWSTESARAKDGSNFSRYESAAFDAAVDSAVASSDPARSRAHFHRAYEIILNDAPAVWLYELRQMAGAHRRIRITGMRADAWWAGLPDWSIPEGERIARDRIGLPGGQQVGRGAGESARVASAAGGTR